MNFKGKSFEKKSDPVPALREFEKRSDFCFLKKSSDPVPALGEFEKGSDF